MGVPTTPLRHSTTKASTIEDYARLTRLAIAPRRDPGQPRWGRCGCRGKLLPAWGGFLTQGLLGGGIYGAQQHSASDNSLLGDIATNAGVGLAGGGVAKLGAKYVLPALAAKFPQFAKFLEDSRGGAKTPQPPAPAPGQRIEPTFGRPTEPAATPTPQRRALTAEEEQSVARRAPAPVAPPEARTVPQEVIPPPAPPAPAAPAAPAAAAPGHLPSQEIAEAKAREGAFNALGLGKSSSPGMIFRDPGTYTEEANAAKTQAQTKVGGAILQKYQAINQALRTHLANIGQSLASPREAGQQIMDVLQGKWEGMQKEIGNLYNGVLMSKGDSYAATPNNLSSIVKEHSANFDADPVTVSIRRKMVDMGLPDPLGQFAPSAGTTQKTALSVADAHNLRKFITHLNPKDATTAFVKREAVKALDDDVIGSSGVDHLKTARAARTGSGLRNLSGDPWGRSNVGRWSPRTFCVSSLSAAR